MTLFTTSHGTIDVKNWGYRLQGAGGSALDPTIFAASDFDLVVTDFSRDGTLAGALSPQDVSAIKTSKVAVSYISIGEASDFRALWNPAWTSTGTATGTLTSQAPTWLGPTNPDWPESRKVRYWDTGWQDLIFNNAQTGWLDKIVSQGFDAAYLDIVDAYYFWAVEATAAQRRAGDPASEMDAAQRMIDFIVDMTAHARQTNPNFFVILQNGAFIIDALAQSDPVRKAALLDAIGAIAVEDVYLRNGSLEENNGYLPDEAVIAVLKRDFLANGKPVFAVDYVSQPDKMGAFLEDAVRDGFIPTVAPTRSLDRTLAPLTDAAHTTEGRDLVAGTALSDTIDAKGSADYVFGFGGNDQLKGAAGNDVLSGGYGNDALWGGPGADTLLGGAGFDWATYADAASGVTASLSAPGGNTGIAAGDRYTSIEGLIGSSSGDVLTGNASANRLQGAAGRDVLAGLGGNDSYFIDRADDIVREVQGAGTDTVFATSTFAMPTFVERLVLTGADNLNALGSAAADTIFGNAGANILRGGHGADRLYGGGGGDTFVYGSLRDSAPASRDVIADFAHRADKIDVSALDANGSAVGSPAFSFIGRASFSRAGGELRIRFENPTGSTHDKTIVEADTNGDGKADLVIELTSLVALSTVDFVL